MPLLAISLPSLVELLAGGLTLGGLYGLIAFTLSLALATTHILNVAHGGFLVLGGAMGTLLITFLKMDPFLGVAIVLGTFLLVGLLFERAFVEPLMGRSPHEILIGSIVTTFGFALAIEAFLGFYWARHVSPQPSFSLTLSLPPLVILGATFSGSRLIILSFAVAATILFHLFLTRTRTGQEARALSQDFEGALILGINPRRISRAIFALGTMATAAAGLLLVLAAPLDPFDGLRLTLIALTILVIGGVGSLPGALLGGILVGEAEVLTAFFIGPAWSPVLYLAVLFAVLLLRPEGLLGVRSH